MKPFFLLTLALLLAGCDTLNWKQYQVSGVRPNSEDSARLEAILQTVATQTGLEARKQSSLVPETIAFYAEPHITNFRVDLGARYYTDAAVVDVIGGIGPTPKTFKKVNNLLVPMLSTNFGSRFFVATERVPLVQN